MVYVFKTSVKTEKDIRKLKPLISELFRQSRWDFDLADCDKILRIDSNTEITASVVRLLTDNGFDCEELAGLAE